jgi:pilus assembly protein FimV
LTFQLHRWHKSVLVALAVCAMAVAGSQAHALSLGRIAIQSAIGEPLRAEIEVTDLGADDATTLRAGVASPNAFSAAGLDYNAVMAGVRANLVQRADGRSFLLITSERPVNDPFLDLLLEARWSAGRVVRYYTLLLDPPSMRAAAAAPALPKVAPATTPAPPPAITQAPTPVAPSAAGASVSSAARAGQVTVKAGDSAGRIAMQAKQSDVTRDQMLVALVQANPEAFIDNNVNRLLAGSVLQVPSAEQARALPAEQASQIILAQNREFNAFRLALAGQAPDANVKAATREAGGKVEPIQQPPVAATGAPDRLTLSKATTSNAPKEADVAKDLADKDAAARAAELARNVEDLSKLSAVSAGAAPPPVGDAASAPANAVSQPVASVAIEAPAVPIAADPAPTQARGILDEMLADPWVPGALVGLVTVLVGVGLYMQASRRRRTTPLDDTQTSAQAPLSPMVHAQEEIAPAAAQEKAAIAAPVASPLDPVDEVDPIAEAEVYLAYGRDAQALEILKQALRDQPQRLAIHMKLLEILCKRGDVSGFHSRALQVLQLSGIGTPEWATACEMGRSIDPDNPLYNPPGAVPAPAAATTTAAVQPATTPQPEPSQQPLPLTEQRIEPPSPVEPSSTEKDPYLDFDLDLNLEEPGTAKPTEATLALTPEPAPRAPTPTPPPPAPAAPSLPSTPTPPAPTPPATPPAQTAAPAAADDDGMLEFDLGSLDLDVSANPGDASGNSEDPLETKLALAEEFLSIGDSDGARALIDEVLAEASGALKAKAERARANLR